MELVAELFILSDDIESFGKQIANDADRVRAMAYSVYHELG